MTYVRTILEGFWLWVLGPLIAICTALIVIPIVIPFLLTWVLKDKLETFSFPGRKGSKQSCKCGWCRSRCKVGPGFFLPGEIKHVAEFLKISLEDLYRHHLEVVEIPFSGPTLRGPNVLGIRPKFVPKLIGGRCIFYQRGMCGIHSVKPFACRETIHDPTARDSEDVINKYSFGWRYNQTEVKEYRKYKE